MKVRTPCYSCFGRNPYCATCHGEGFIWIEGEAEKLPPTVCSSCQGKGFIIKDNTQEVKVCPNCQGTGKTSVI